MAEGFKCEVHEWYRSACEGQDFFGEDDGKRYCVLHFPSVDKNLAEFKETIEEKLKDKDFDFRGVYFPGDQSLASFLPNDAFEGNADFTKATFVGEVSFPEVSFEGKADFSRATFEGVVDFSEATFKRKASFTDATFKRVASFSKATFGEEALSPEAKAFIPWDTFEGDADFSGATFGGDADFSGATFEGTASFSRAHFEGEAYLQADFYGATFNRKASFSDATFRRIGLFTGATFKEQVSFFRAIFERKGQFSTATFVGEASFFIATFKEEAQFFRTTFKRGASFPEATFERAASFPEVTFEGDADFSKATFEGDAGFSGATFKEKGKFWSLQTSPETRLDFSAAVIEKSERLSFHSTYLRPSWFVDVDAQNFDFSDVEWFRLPDGDELRLENDIETLEARGYRPPSNLRILQKACRKLMNNAEDNRDYPTANEFHYWSMEAVRKEGWSRLGIIASLYWALSGYGERPRRAFWVLVTIWFAFAALYFLLIGSSPFWVFSASDMGEGISYAGQALVYSLSALVRLNPRPQSEELDWFHTVVTIEGILGPVQIGLLLLAIRRQVMR